MKRNARKRLAEQAAIVIQAIKCPQHGQHEAARMGKHGHWERYCPKCGARLGAVKPLVMR